MSLALRILVAVTALALLAGGGMLSARLLAAPGQPTGTASPRARFQPPRGQVYLGVSTHDIRAGVEGWSKAAGITGQPALYGRWTTPNGSFAPILAEAAARPGITPIVHWNLPFTGGRITNGSRDAYIKAQAAAVKAHRGPVFIRLNWEMNTDFYPGWNPPAVPPKAYLASWRHVVRHFSDVRNVAFVWAPNVFGVAGHRTAEFYPGDDHVDWIGLDAYPQSAPADTLLHKPDAMEDMARFAERRRKPMMLAEWAVNSPHPDSAEPIALVLDWAARHPLVQALVYFDFKLPDKDFRLATHPIAARAFRARTADRGRFLVSVPG